MVAWEVVLSKSAVKDAQKSKQAGLKKQALTLLNVLKKDPYSNYPAYETSVGNLSGFYSRRINIQHRLIYRIDEKNKTVHVLRMWSHYE